MIKFKDNHKNNLDELIKLVYKILNNSYNEYTRKKEQQQIQESLKSKFQNLNPYMNANSLTKIMNDLNKVL